MTIEREFVAPACVILLYPLHLERISRRQGAIDWVCRESRTSEAIECRG